MAGIRHFRQPLATLVTLAVIGSAVAAVGQPRSQEDINNQIQRSAALQREALQALSDGAKAATLIDRARAELQGALSAMIINASKLKFPDPLLPIQRRKGEEALSLLQAAGDELKTHAAAQGQERAGANLQMVRGNIEQALRLTTALAL